MATQVSICNIALGNVGGKSSISALNENSKEALHCNRVYDACLRLVLRAHNWAFAKAYVALNNLGSPPANWAYRYQYPSDCLKARELVRGTTEDTVPFEVAAGDTASSRVLLTDRESAVLVYTRYMNDPTYYPPDFVMAFAWLISGHIAVPVSGDIKLRNDAFKMYASALDHAGANSANEGTSTRKRTPGWMSARA